MKQRHLLIISVTIFAKMSQIQENSKFFFKNQPNLVEYDLKMRGSNSMIAFVIGKNQNIRKSTLLHSLFITQCLDNLSSCKLTFFLCISIEKMEPRIIPRSRPTASTSKRTSASIFSIAIPKENSQITLGKIFQTL